MNRILIVLVACGLFAVPAHAMADRTFVSGKGTDSGTCAYASPCRSFAFALSQTATGGEIDVLDPGGFGAVTITKAISIVNDGVGTAGIMASSGNAITIASIRGNGTVRLRGLTIEGLGTGANGILFNTGSNLEIENCVIRAFNKAAINIAPTQTQPVTGLLRNVIASGGLIGISVASGSSTSVNVTVVDSVASGYNGFGIEALSAFTQVMVRNSVVSNSATGLFPMSGAIIRVGHSVVTGNAVGVNADAGGTLFNYGDNDIDGNVNNNTGVLTPLAMH
ncbi:MAG: right-handed parallel beta-helix repeat-containing protein [Methylocella sp.]